MSKTKEGRRRIVLDVRTDQKEWLQGQVKEFESLSSVVRDLIDKAMERSLDC